MGFVLVSLLKISFAICLFVAAAAPSRAAIIASDQFLVGGGSNYTAGTSINAQTATGGTVGYFTGVGTNPTAGWSAGTSAANVAAGGLTHPLTVNAPAPAGDGKFYAIGNGNSRVQYRDFATIAPAAAPVYYFSTLMQESSNSYTGNTYVGLGPSRAAGASATLPTTGFNIGFTNGAITLWYNNGGAALVTQTLVATPAAGTTYLATLTFDTATSMLTPTIYDQAGNIINNPVTQTVTATVNTATDLGSFQGLVGVNFNAGLPAQVYYDEFRFGTALADVVNLAAIPEPGTLAALSLFGISYYVGRRYRVKT